MKKFISWDIFHLSLILSLLRLYPDLYGSNLLENANQPSNHQVLLGASSAYTQTHFHNLNNRLNGYYVHPKNVDESLIRSLLAHDRHRLSHRPSNDIIAYIVNGQQPAPSVNNSRTDDRSDLEEQRNNAELTQEDMDLIEILWKQDIDLGISRNVFDGSWSQELKEKETNASEASDKKQEATPALEDPWEGLQYIIDSETGEHILKHPDPEQPQQVDNALQEVPTTNTFTDITLEEALQFFETENNTGIKQPVEIQPPALVDDLIDEERQISLLEELKDLQDMVSEESRQQQNWNDSYMGAFASNDNNTNSTPFVDALFRNTSMGLPAEDLSYPQFGLPTTDDILSLLTNGSDPDPFASIAAQYSGENPLDLLDIPHNMTASDSELNLISSMLSQESLEFMDLQINNNGANFFPEISDDSAISCNETKHMDWHSSSNAESGYSESYAAAAQQQTPQKKYHFFGKNNSTDNESSSESDSGCSNSVKSYLSSPKDYYNTVAKQESESSSSTSAEAELLMPHEHNHTYHREFVPEHRMPDRFKDKEKVMTKEEEETEQRSRDEKRALELKLPLTIKDITSMPIEEFNDKLTKMDLTEEQSNLIKDIRRRGKNKVAAQNCRKRKMEQINSLQKRLEDLQHERHKLMTEQTSMSAHREFLQSKYHRLYQFLFESNMSHSEPPPPFFPSGSSTEQLQTPRMAIPTGNATRQDGANGEGNKGARVKRKVNKNK